MIPDLQKEQPTYRETLNQAQGSANAGNAMEMFQSLCGSIVFDGYLKFFSKKYPTVDRNDIYDVIGISNDELYDRVRRGEKIYRVDSYLWKVIDRKLSEFADNKKLYLGNDIENIGVNDVKYNLEELKDNIQTKQKKLFDMVEGLIPKLRIGNVQNVMKYIFKTIRNGAEDVPNQEIADALGLMPPNVRQCRKRGFERLARIVKEENLIDDSHDFMFLQEMEYYIDEIENETDLDEQEIIE